MANFTVRVELHGATSADYTKLHEDMEKGGFSRTAKIGDSTFKLPTAEYYFQSNTLDRGQVRDKAKGIAEKIKKKPAILVTESDGRACTGLEEV